MKVEVGVNAAGKGAGGASIDAVTPDALVIRNGQSGHALGFWIAPGDIPDADRAFLGDSAAASGHEDNRTARQRTTGRARGPECDSHVAPPRWGASKEAVQSS